MLRSVNLRCRKELTTQLEEKKRPDIAVYNYIKMARKCYLILLSHILQLSRICQAVVKRRLLLHLNKKIQRKQSTPRKLKLPDISSDLSPLKSLVVGARMQRIFYSRSLCWHQQSSTHCMTRKFKQSPPEPNMHEVLWNIDFA